MSTLVYFVERDGLGKLYSFEPMLASALSPAVPCRLDYLNEGGANFVYTIAALPGATLPSRLRHRLLRLGKALPHVPSAEYQLQAVNANFRDLFPPQHLLQHDLVHLEQGVPIALGDSLQKVSRPRHRIGTELPAEPMSGLLITDMTPAAGEVLVQLKPKWLTQSRNAPANARRCRTCALRAQRASERIRTATDAQETCPLGLIHEDLDKRKEAVYAITTDRRIREYLLGQAQALLQQLRNSQMSLDSKGVLSTTGAENIYSLCKAMTLRDCTLFIKRSGKIIDARLGDLDLKQPEKLARWRMVESTLINDGWYMNAEHEDVWTKERICTLARA